MVGSTTPGEEEASSGEDQLAEQYPGPRCADGASSPPSAQAGGGVSKPSDIVAMAQKPFAR